MTETIEDVGIVREVQDGKVTVELKRGGGCKSCSMRNICSPAGKPVILEFDTELTLKPGDRVLVMIEPRFRILSAVIVFLLPLIGLIGGYILAKSFFTEGISIVIGFASLIIVFFIVRYLDRLIGRRISFALRGKCEDMSQ